MTHSGGSPPSIDALRKVHSPGMLAVSDKRDSRNEVSGISAVVADLSKFHQVLRDEHLAGKVLLHFLSKAHVIIIRISSRRNVRQNHRLDTCARGHLPEFIWKEVFLSLMAHEG